GDARFCTHVPESHPGPAGRRPRPPICGRDGVRDARAKIRSERLSLERAQGANSSGGAPDSFVPARPSARLESFGNPRRGSSMLPCTTTESKPRPNTSDGAWEEVRWTEAD